MIGTALAQLRQTVPAMVVLGPVMAVQCIAWRLPRGAARTTRDYEASTPSPHARDGESLNEKGRCTQMTKAGLRYLKYAIATLSTVGDAIPGS